MAPASCRRLAGRKPPRDWARATRCARKLLSDIAEQKTNGVRKKCIAFKMTDKSAPPRQPMQFVRPAGRREVVSGTQSPSLGIGIGMGYAPPEFAKKDTAIEIEIRGKRAAAVVVAKPIYRKS